MWGVTMMYPLQLLRLFLDPPDKLIFRGIPKKEHRWTATKTYIRLPRARPRTAQSCRHLTQASLLLTPGAT